MITGFVNSYREPVVPIEIRGDGNRRIDVDAIVDTGFNGTLTLPSSVIAQLGLQFRRRGRAVLADGCESVFDVYEGVVVWDGVERRISVDEADTDPLIGMTLLYGHELFVEVVDGGTVTITKTQQSN